MPHLFEIETFANGCVTGLTVIQISMSLLLEGAYTSQALSHPLRIFQNSLASEAALVSVVLLFHEYGT
jgi:hypothetical protein